MTVSTTELDRSVFRPDTWIPIDFTCKCDITYHLAIRPDERWFRCAACGRGYVLSLKVALIELVGN